MVLEKTVYPDPLLRNVSTPVDVIDEEIRILAENMLDTMYDEGGVGLAAPQIGINKRVIVIDTSRDRNQPECYVNPEITLRSGKSLADEGCLSVPGITAEVERAEHVEVIAQNLDGEELEISADGLAARAFQHEIDHLDGILFIDKLDTAERFRVRDQIANLEEVYKSAEGV
ncbi:MAG: peptide deformylase [Planctomycetes bacterium]|nr:peptide deformylase [Planctomycetota bacterium]